MKPNELFKHLRNVDYINVGKKLDYFLETDDKNKIIRVMFQESKQKLDWFFNFLFMLFPTVIGGCPYWFSIGWWTSWESARKLILHCILSEIEKHKNYKIEICGFSFGGAIAQLCGIEVFEATGMKSDLITFGSPKPLFNFFTKLKAKRCFNSVTQYAHWSDIVTWCPPLFGYHTVKNTRLGKFSLKGLFDVYKYHQIYSDETIYEVKNEDCKKS